MGENIYSDRYVFVRELLQNAIDTTRHRVYYEQSTSSHRYEPRPIRVSDWEDEAGYQWIRIDDDGMGMDETLVRNF
jgi:HSP90 family molecular chaperone